MECPKCFSSLVSPVHVRYCKGDDTDLMRQALIDIDKQLRVINYEDLSQAERNIIKILNRFALPKKD